MVQGPHTDDSTVHRTTGSEDVSTLVAAESRIQSFCQPVPRDGSVGLVRAVPGPRRLPRYAADFVRAYQADRHGFEARYQALDDVARAALALRQGATHVVAAAPPKHDGLRESAAGAGPLELLHVEGDLAVYRVRFAQLVQRQR